MSREPTDEMAGLFEGLGSRADGAGQLASSPALLVTVGFLVGRGVDRDGCRRIRAHVIFVGVSARSPR